jgi:hypothetical protein
MKRAIFCAVMLMATVSHGMAEPKNDKMKAKTADVVITGHVIATGFGSSDLFDPSIKSEFAVIAVESIEKGEPVKPLKLLLDDSLQDLSCCASGVHFRMYLKHKSYGFYSAIGGHNGVVRLNGQGSKS